MENNKIYVVATLKDAVLIGVKNIISLLILVVLYVLTVWIPYLNVGTTIGLYKVIVSMSKGETVDPLSIFDKENFARIGNFFLLLGLLTIGITAACAFMFVPALIIGIAWGYAIFFLIDKKISPLKSLTLSYDVTFGEKWRIFAVNVIVCLAVFILAGLLGAIPKVGGFLAVIVAIAGTVYSVAVEALLYKHFSAKADEIIASKSCCCAVPEGEPKADEPDAA